VAYIIQVLIIETAIFTRQVQAAMAEEAYRELQAALIARPDLGSVIAGGGGLRKVRWRASGRGKRGGARIIYYWAVNQEVILMLFLYPKNVQGDLHPITTQSPPGRYRRGISMKEDVFHELLESVRAGGEILRGKREPSRVFAEAEVPDITTLRERFGLSQAKFATLLGISIGTLRNWEQQRRIPDGPARVLLRIAAKHPEAVLDTVASASDRRYLARKRAVARKSA
jgi:putative transcriptional regulator